MMETLIHIDSYFFDGVTLSLTVDMENGNASHGDKLDQETFDRLSEALKAALTLKGMSLAIETLRVMLKGLVGTYNQIVTEDKNG